jgi:hypothetical protein
MKFREDRPFAGVDAAVKKLLEIAKGLEPDHAGRINVGAINAQFMSAGGDPPEYSAAVKAGFEAQGQAVSRRAIAELDQGEKPKSSGNAKGEGIIFMNDNKDAFDLWWEWAEKPVNSTLTIDAAIHDAVMALPPDERRDRAKVNAAVRDGLRLGPLRPAGSADLYGVPKATK